MIVRKLVKYLLETEIDHRRATCLLLGRAHNIQIVLYPSIDRHRESSLDGPRFKNDPEDESNIDCEDQIVVDDQQISKHEEGVEVQ